MSSKTNEKRDMESIDLLDYLRKEIPVEDLRDFESPKRINSIDFVKGFAIVFIILAHIAGAWLNSQWIFLYGIVFAFLDVLGPSLFVFLSALSVIFSVRKKLGILPENVIRNRILTRGIVIMVIGVIFNIISIDITIAGYPFPLNLWGWNILMFIGISQILSLYALKLSKMTRLMIGFVIIFTSDPIREFIFNGVKAGNVILEFLHYIIISPSPMTPILPWVSICFISTIYGEFLYEAMIGGSKTDYIVLIRKFLFSGVFFTAIGIFLGRLAYIPGDSFIHATDYAVGTLPLSEYPHILLYKYINSQMIIPEIRYPGMWEFLIRGRGPNMIYNLGTSLLIIGICFYFIDLKKKKNIFTNMLMYYGKTSLSLFLIHFVFITLFIGQFDIVIFPFIYIGYAGLMGFLMYIWIEYFRGVGSPEWIMIQLGRIGQKTTEVVKKEIQTIEEEIKETIHKRKKEEKSDKSN
ncbi:MAG: heparan-alpha-glucosaminide N-acetyltransferase domain-containing protein [Promethearchaeota archaeon]